MVRGDGADAAVVAAAVTTTFNGSVDSESCDMAGLSVADASPPCTE